MQFKTFMEKELPKAKAKFRELVGVEFEKEVYFVFGNNNEKHKENYQGLKRQEIRVVLFSKNVPLHKVKFFCQEMNTPKTKYVIRFKKNQKS